VISFILEEIDTMPNTLSREEWQQLLAEQAASQRTIREFCQEKGIGLSTFSRWRQRLAGTPGPQARSGSSFVPVAVPPRSDITVHAGSATVTLSSMVSPQWLAAFIKALQD
jgi:hypothetical protein